MDPLDILFPELWRLIFAKLEEDPQDWLNLYRASPTFEAVVGEEELSQVLITKVLPLVRKHLVVDDKAFNLNGLLPLTLRLVSKRWKKAVDATLGPPEIPFGEEETGFAVENRNFDSGVIGRKYSFGGDNNFFWLLNNISSFLQKFATHPGNPFVGNFVQIWLQVDDDSSGERMMEMERGEEVQRLMERFGSQITRLSVRRGYSDSNPRLDILVDQIQSCVQLAPNLESLTVRFDGSDYPIAYRRDNPPVLGNQPPPLVIPSLKSFSFFTSRGGIHGTSGFIMDLQNTLVRLCCNPNTLKTVEVVGVPAALTTFPNLETASVVVTLGHNDIFNLLNSSWPLTRLTLTAPGLVLWNVVECVEHFKNTLTSLWITCDIAGSGMMEPWSMGFGPDLPRLKFLIVHSQYLSAPFVSKLPSLERLRIFEKVRTEGDVDIWFGAMEAQFSEFKIWDNLPKKVRKIEMVARYRIDYSDSGLKSVCKVSRRAKKCRV